MKIKEKVLKEVEVGKLVYSGSGIYLPQVELINELVEQSIDLTLAKVRKVIDGMISFSEKKKKELEKRGADLIEIVPHIDYVAVLKELKQKLGGGA